MPNTINTLAEIGYQTGVAHGSADVEEQALEQAIRRAHPDVLARQAEDVTRESLQQLHARGQLPPDGEPRQQFASRIAAAALETLGSVADENVRFHQRALDHARSTPTVWHVEGHGVSLYIPVDDQTGHGADKDARKTLDSLVKLARDAS